MPFRSLKVHGKHKHSHGCFSRLAFACIGELVNDTIKERVAARVVSCRVEIEKMSASKLSPPLLHVRLNVLQPKKLNTSSNTPVSLIHGNNNKIELNESTPKAFNPSSSGPNALPRLILPSITPPSGVGLAKLLKLSMSSANAAPPLPTQAHTATVTAASTSGGPRRGVHTMAKRNARERNRVKMVNQGFQTLRQHIPDRFRLKKMSKVDTLRCALDYIRSLSQVLDIPSLEIKSELSLDEESLNTCVTSDESGLHCSAGEEYSELDSICNFNNDATQQQSFESVSSHHLLFKNKSTHSGSTIHYNNGNVAESENKQAANGLVLVLPSPASSSSSSNFLGRIRTGKENEEYVAGLPQCECGGEGDENFPRRPSCILESSSSNINVESIKSEVDMNAQPNN